MMFKRILVPLDGSDFSEWVLPQIDRLIQEDGVEVTFFHCIADSDSFSADAVQEVHEYLDPLKEVYTDRGASVFVGISRGDPADQILRLSEVYDPSLICMSTHGRTGLSRWVRGSVAERVLRHANHPLLLMNPLGFSEFENTSELGFKRILVPLDGSAEAAGIIPMVVEFAKVFGSEVTLLYAQPIMVTTAVAVPDIPFQAFIDQGGPDVTGPHLATFVNAGVSVVEKSAFGLPAEAILKEAEEEAVDLIAMTTHGRSGISRWVFGSVAEQVLRHAECPLLVMRTGKGD